MKSCVCFAVCVIFIVSLAFPPEAPAQVREVVVGITPSCPYGLPGCWGGAAEGLARLSGVESIGKSPDDYNSTAHVYLKDRETLPDVTKWRTDFKTTTNDAYGFRGVEVTVEAAVVFKDQVLVLRLPNGKELRLMPLQHKLQWNYKKGSARQPEPDEANAYPALKVELEKVTKAEQRVLLTGPLVEGEYGLSLEVREFFLLKE